ncbi:MAG: tRNA threonylcarbamoyladenosine dehydratase [Desulfitobacterium hafniense]|nr:tRNA threonylcarbamoyladenosine dehydratase [Desulfitobacterium hafniense]
MQHKFSRTELLIGQEGLNKLARCHVIIFGIGGVGSFTAEALARAGIGSLTLVDFDDICLTNINRQLHALHSTIGEPKVEVMKKRILEINPSARVTAVKEFYKESEAERFLNQNLDYVVDAIDTVSSKVSLAKECLERDLPIISSMGAGNRLDANNYRIADISKTSGCPLAKAMRKLLKKHGITSGLKTVYCPDLPQTPLESESDCRNNCICPGGDAHCSKKRQIPGSISFVPSVVGLLIAGEVIRDLLIKN